MVKVVESGAARDALEARLRAIAPHLLATAPESTAELITALSATARRGGSAPQWLLLTALAGSMPTTEEFVAFRRTLETVGQRSDLVAALEGAIGPASRSNYKARAFDVVAGSVVVDVDFCARHGHNTGVQRVTRSLASRWDDDPDVVLAAWTLDGMITRRLSSAEQTRVVAWNSSLRLDSSGIDDDDEGLIVPWNGVIVLPEVAQTRICDRLACAAQYSGNRVVMVGHDTIPITSAIDVIPEETERFVRYLSIVKHASALAGVSRSAASEFEGFIDAVRGQGIVGPQVSSIPLPLEHEEEDLDAERHVGGDLPLVLSVGSQEPRKNQVALLAASELLWQDGVRFRLMFIGGNAGILSREFDDEIDRLQRAGHPVVVLRSPSDAVLRDAYHEAEFSVMISTHEGFGLPVAESIALGTPCLTSDYGSLAETAALGGCVTVDPRDDLAIAAAMRRMLGEPELIARLRAEIARVPDRTWDDYATELRELVDAQLEVVR